MRPEETPSNRARRADRGSSAVELIIVIAILGSLSTLLTSVLMDTLVASAEVQLQSTGSVDASLAVDEVVRRLRAGVVVQGMSTTTLAFQEPVDADGDGDFFDDLGDLELGAEGSAGWTYVFELQLEGTVKESVLGLDVNGDGDANDTFQIGRLVAKVLDAASIEVQTRLLAGGERLLVPSPGDSTLPALFADPSGAGEGVTVSVTRLQTTEKAEADGPRVFRRQRVVTFR